MRLFDASYVWGQSSVSAVVHRLSSETKGGFFLDETVLFDFLGLRVIDTVSFTYVANAQPV